MTIEQSGFCCASTRRPSQLQSASFSEIEFQTYGYADTTFQLYWLASTFIFGFPSLFRFRALIKQTKIRSVSKVT